MRATGKRAPAPDAAGQVQLAAAPTRRGRRADPIRTALAVEGTAGAFLASRDGSPGWQVVRGVIVVVMTGAALLAASRLTSRTRAAAAFLTGAVGTTVGIGIGAGHVTGGELGPVAVAGLACLGGRLRHERPACAARAGTPATYGMAYRDVTFPTPDGVLLAGWYVSSRTGAAVVLRHGAGSTRSDVLAQAAALARHGFGVLLTDARGHGRSCGRAMDFGWYGDLDVAGAVSFLERQPAVDARRIGAVGLSMGGEEVVGAAAADTRIRGVVAEGATGRAAADLGWLDDRYGLRGAFTQAWKGLLTFRLADALTAAHPPRSLRSSVAAAAPRPVLLITAGDVAEEAAAADFIRSGSTSTVTVWEVPATGHTRGIATHPQEWEQRVVEFLEQALA